MSPIKSQEHLSRLVVDLARKQTAGGRPSNQRILGWPRPIYLWLHNSVIIPGKFNIHKEFQR